VKKYASKGEIQSSITLSKINEDSVTFRLEQGNPTTQGVFVAGMDAIALSLQSYLKILA